MEEPARVHNRANCGGGRFRGYPKRIAMGKYKGMRDCNLDSNDEFEKDDARVKMAGLARTVKTRRFQ
jgi:hypothetical protein